MIFMNLARGINAWDKTDIRADREPIVSVMSAIASLWWLFDIRSDSQRLKNKVAHMAITMVGGNAPFNISRKDRESSSRRALHVSGLSTLRGLV